MRRVAWHRASIESSVGTCSHCRRQAISELREDGGALSLPGKLTRGVRLEHHLYHTHNARTHECTECMQRGRWMHNVRL